MNYRRTNVGVTQCLAANFWALIFVSLAVAMAGAAVSPAVGLSQWADSQTKRAVEGQLVLDPAISAHLVDVEVKDGIVTLSGSVNTLWERERSQEMTETVRGVRSVVNTIVVNATPRSDKQIKTDIQAALAEDPATDLYEIRVEVTNGTAILTGTVDSLAERELAADVAQQVNGVKMLKNDVVARPKAKRPDQQVAADIRNRLRANPWVHAELIDVAVDDGTVTLQGIVGSALERTHAGKSSWVAGVTSVNTDPLKVVFERPAPMIRKPSTDEELKQMLMSAFRQDPRVQAFKLEVEVDHRMVTLDGVVDNLKAKKAAEEIAKTTLTVTQVENHIKVRPEKIPEDAAIARAVKEALLRDAYVSRYDFSVAVRNAKVHLNGKVDSSHEKSHAEGVVSRVGGVVDVQNNLAVVDLEIPTKNDWDLQRDIKTILGWNVFTHDSDISVSVKDGIATLSGTVDSWRTVNAATDAARSAGAESVLNQLQVKSA